MRKPTCAIAWTRARSFVESEITVFDWQISFGNVLTIASFVLGGLAFVWTMKSQIDSLGSRTRTMEGELKKLVEILVNQGRQDERMNSLDQRMLVQGQRLDHAIERFDRISDFRKGD